MLNRKDIRESYLPFLMEIFQRGNQSTKCKILDIFIMILVKLADHQCRQKIQSFLNEDLAMSKSIYDRKIFIVFCAKICPKISKKYFKDVFAFSYLKIIEERKKDIAICFSQNIVEIRKKIDDIGSTSKIEMTLSSVKNVFHKDNFI